MYESVNENLKLLLCFALIGFFLSFIYEFFRILRRLIPHSAVAIGVQDFLFLSFAGIVTVAYSMEFGTGEFRILFVVAQIFGGMIYFITVGAFISYITRKFAEAIHKVLMKIWRKVLKPVMELIDKYWAFLSHKFVKYHNNNLKRLKNHIRYLKSRCVLVYNKPNVALKYETDGKHNVIKAKISKKA